MASKTPKSDPQGSDGGGSTSAEGPSTDRLDACTDANSSQGSASGQANTSDIESLMSLIMAKLTSWRLSHDGNILMEVMSLSERLDALVKKQSEQP